MRRRALPLISLLVALLTSACAEPEAPGQAESDHTAPLSEAHLPSRSPGLRPAAVDAPPAWGLPEARRPALKAVRVADPEAPDVHLNPRAAGPMVMPSTDLSPEPVAKTVFGRDDRIPVVDTAQFPHSAVISLRSQWGDRWYVCSGAVVNDIWVLTAAHCVFNAERGGWADDLVIIPGRSPDREPFGRYDWERVHAPSGYTQGDDGAWDMALIEVRGTIGDATGWFGMWMASDEAYGRNPLYTAGYPGSNSSQQVRGVCEVVDLDERVHHRCDTEGGQSGSPMWMPNDGEGTYVTAVHYGARAETNVAARLRPSTWAWMNAARGRCDNHCTYEAVECTSADRRRTCVLSDGCMAWRESACGTGERCAAGVCACEEDRFEPSRDGRPHTIEPGHHRDLKICSGDDDWYRLSVRRGQRVTIQVLFSHGEGDLDVELQADGQTLQAATSSDDDERLELLADQDTDLQLRIYGYNGSAAAYALEVQVEQVVPRAWSCPLEAFGGGDGCNCACGAVDPDCADRQAPVLGCGAQDTCDDAGACQCVPACDGRSCGPDGCGGTCGDCGESARCTDGACVCEPGCDGRTCGADGCGGTCGTCGDGSLCADGACVCAPSCDGRTCGSDGCGGTCGTCSDGAQCADGACTQQPPPMPTLRPAKPTRRNGGGGCSTSGDGPGPRGPAELLLLAGLALWIRTRRTPR